MSVLFRASCIQSAFLRSSRCSTGIPIFVTYFGARKHRLWGNNSVNSPVQKSNAGFKNFPSFGDKTRDKDHSNDESEKKPALNWKNLIPLAATVLIAFAQWRSVFNLFSNYCSQLTVYCPGLPEPEGSDSEFSNSRDPLANLDGDRKAMGIIKGNVLLAEGMPHAISSDYVFVTEMDLRTKAGVPFYGHMGLALITLTGEIVADWEQRGVKVFSSQGVLVFQVVDGSLAFLAGIQPGDIIVKINDTNISSVKHFYGVLDVLHLEAAPTVHFSLTGRRNKKTFRSGTYS